MIFSWQGVALITVLLLRKLLTKIVARLIAGNDSKAKLGPIEIELGKLAEDGGKAVSNINEISLIVARGKLIELEFAEKSVSATFSDTQKKELSCVIKELRLKLRELEKPNV
jgi:hypothetical protein